METSRCRVHWHSAPWQMIESMATNMCELIRSSGCCVKGTPPENGPVICILARLVELARSLPSKTGNATDLPFVWIMAPQPTAPVTSSPLAMGATQGASADRAGQARKDKHHRQAVPHSFLEGFPCQLLAFSGCHCVPMAGLILCHVNTYRLGNAKVGRGRCLASGPGRLPKGRGIYSTDLGPLWRRAAAGGRFDLVTESGHVTDLFREHLFFKLSVQVWHLWLGLVCLLASNGGACQFTRAEHKVAAWVGEKGPSPPNYCMRGG